MSYSLPKELDALFVTATASNSTACLLINYGRYLPEEDVTVIRERLKEELQRIKNISSTAIDNLHRLSDYR